MNRIFSHTRTCALILTSVFLLPACVEDSKQYILSTEKSQAELRSIQTRSFDTEDRRTAVQTVLATLQDLGFVIDQADENLGVISATKLDGYKMRMTVTIRKQVSGQIMVRASAQYGMKAVSDSEPYQNFFAALEQAMSLNLDAGH